MDNFLTPVVKKGLSFLWDTSDFLLKLQDIGGLHGDELQLTLDVTNISNDEGTMAVLRALRKAQPDDVQPINLSLVEMLAQVFSNNNFKFDGKNYLQIRGTAMGTRVTPSYANMFMKNFKEKEYSFCIWQHCKDKNETVHQFLGYNSSPTRQLDRYQFVYDGHRSQQLNPV